MTKIHGGGIRHLVLLTFAVGLVQTATLRAQEDEAKLVRIDASVEPIPALKYRLVPSSAGLVPGNAAPIYLRLVHELRGDAFGNAAAEAKELLDANDKDFSAKDAEKLLDRWTSRLQQIEFGTRRRDCDWNYTIMDQREEVLGILLPDASAMRVWGRLLAVKARLEIVEGKHEKALRTIQTGMTFARHVGQGPFLVNRLVGMHIADIVTDQLVRFVQSKGAPNLYWALSAAPRPFVPLRGAIELEHRVGTLLVPELDHFEELSADGEWEFLFRRIEKRIRGIDHSVVFPEQKDRIALPSTKAKWALSARRYLTKDRRWAAKDVEAMSDEQAIVLYVVHAFRKIRDNVFKCTYLDYPDAFRQYGSMAKKLDAARQDAPELSLFIELMPAMGRAHLAEAKLQRRLESLRAVEAIRLSIKDGKLPASSKETVLPLPKDPITNLPFNYKASGHIGVLSAPKVSEAFKSETQGFFRPTDDEQTKIEFRLTVRKQD